MSERKPRGWVVFGDDELAFNGVERAFGDDDDREWLACSPLLTEAPVVGNLPRADLPGASTMACSSRGRLCHLDPSDMAEDPKRTAHILQTI